MLWSMKHTHRSGRNSSHFSKKCAFASGFNPDWNTSHLARFCLLFATIYIAHLTYYESGVKLITDDAVCCHSVSHLQIRLAVKNSLSLASHCNNDNATLGSPTPDLVKIKAVYLSFCRDEQYNAGNSFVVWKHLCFTASKV